MIADRYQCQAESILAAICYLDPSWTQFPGPEYDTGTPSVFSSRRGAAAAMRWMSSVEVTIQPGGCGGRPEVGRVWGTRACSDK
jgi:uncharacterized protein (DUF433 family)